MARSFRRWPRGLLLACIVLLFGGWFGWRQLHDVPLAGDSRAVANPAEHPPHEGECSVLEVVAGDSLLISQHQRTESGERVTRVYRLRLLGIDVPASHSAQARELLARQTAAGPLALQLDLRRSDGDGAALGHLYVGDQLAAAVLIRAGLARFADYPGDDAGIGRLLGESQDEARRERRGIWATGAP